MLAEATLTIKMEVGREDRQTERRTTNDGQSLLLCGGTPHGSRKLVLKTTGLYDKGLETDCDGKMSYEDSSLLPT